MESRKITVVSTKNQRKYTINSEAETLGQLKADLKANNIDYNDMEFIEGLTKTFMISDDTVLPKDVMYKGNTTNELVFMLTNTNKKIKSGNMTRKEAYEAIRNNNLQTKVVEAYGKNFTMCKTEDLISIIVDNAAPVKTVVKKIVAEKPASCKSCVDINARKAIKLLLNDLYYETGEINTVTFEEINELIKIDSSTEKIKSPYTDGDVDEIFSFMD